MYRDKKGKSPSPKSDSGYSSGGSSTAEERLYKGFVKEQQRRFNTFIQKLTELEFSTSEEKHENQMRELEQYLYLEEDGAKEKKQRGKELHFTRLDVTAGESLPSTGLLNNEGSAFFAIVRVCSNTKLIKEILETISAEKDKSEEYLIRHYVDKDSYNILHYLADIIVRKEENGFPITEKDWEAFKYFAGLVPELKNQKDFCERTPEDIIIEQTNLTLGKRESYIIPR